MEPAMETSGSKDVRMDCEGDDTFSILVATDLHLGYKNKDPVLENDAINTFEEVLQIAQNKQVDFVLLGGDLFHDSNPPRHVLYSTMQLIKRYCLGKRGPLFDIQEPTPFVVNESREDASHWKVFMPVFSIHGNHDEPTGPGNLSVMDLLHSSGLVRYFGKTSSMDEIHLQPVLLKKGSSKLALYGVGSIRADKLRRMYSNNSVILERPQQDPDSWFNVFVLHQNRATNRDNTHVEEGSIHGFLDLVIWGHEHESRLQPVQLQGKGGQYFLSQPGSTIATEFKTSETVQKHVGLLTVHGKHFQMRPLPLQTVRQMFILEQVPAPLPKSASSEDEQKAMKNLMEECRVKVEKVLSEAEKSRGPQQPKQPLIRIKVRQPQQAGWSRFRFGLQFKGRVANPDTILAFGQRADNDDTAVDFSFPRNPDASVFSVQELFRMQLREKPLKLQILHATDLLEAVKNFVDNNEKQSIKTTIGNHLTRVQMELNTTVAMLPTSTSQNPVGGQGGDMIVDSDEDLTQSIDMLSQSFAEDGCHHNGQRSDTDLLGQSAVPTGSNDGPRNASTAADSGVATDFVTAEDEESWFLEREHNFFQAASNFSQFNSKSKSSRKYRSDQPRQSNASSLQIDHILISDSDSSSSCNEGPAVKFDFHNRPLSKSGLHQNPSGKSGFNQRSQARSDPQQTPSAKSGRPEGIPQKLGRHQNLSAKPDLLHGPLTSCLVSPASGKKPITSAAVSDLESNFPLDLFKRRSESSIRVEDNQGPSPRKRLALKKPDV